MKSLLLLLITLVSLQCAAQQPYRPMLGHTNKWLVIGWFEACGTDSLFTSGDTVVNSRSYKILKGSNYVIGPKSIITTGYLREDSVARKVYALKLSQAGILDTTERVLYDFSLNAGDSILLYNSQIMKVSGSRAAAFPDTFGYYYLDSITNVTVLQGVSRLFHLRRKSLLPYPPFLDETTWLEGVGEITLIAIGITGNLYHHFMQNSSVSCAYRDGVQTVSNFVNGLDTCYCKNVSNVEDIQKTEYLLISPNPAAAYISFPGLSSTFRVEIYNSNGSRCSSVVANDRLDVRGLVPGLYHIVGYNNRLIYRGSFIKQ